MRNPRPKSIGLALMAVLALAAVQSAEAAVICVPNMWDASCTGSAATIAAAVGAAVAGDTVYIDNGNYLENNITVAAGIKLEGRTRAGVVVDCNANTIGFKITSGDVEFRKMTIQNCSQGLRYENAGNTLNRDWVILVTLQNHSSRCIEVHNNTTLTNTLIRDSLFDNCSVGMRFASSAVGRDINMRRVTMQNMGGTGLGFYQANDGSSGYVRDLLIDESTFSNIPFAAVYGEELELVTVQNSTFTDVARGVYLYGAYNTVAGPMGDFTIRGNTFVDSANAAVEIIGWEQLDLPVAITGNTITADVAKLVPGWGQQIDIRLSDNPLLTHAPVTIDSNKVTFSGTFGGGSTSAYAVKVRGNFDGVSMSFNQFDGGGVGDNGGSPATAGVWLVSNDANYGQAPAGAALKASCNWITDFVNGVVVYDTVTPGLGGLLPGVIVDFDSNNIWNNSAFGMLNAPGETIDAENNWWGTTDGPSGVGPGSGDAVSTQVDFSPFQVWPLDEQCVPLEVKLESFSAEPAAGGVMLRWTTRGERETVGFRILRAADQRKADAFEILTADPIPATGGALQGAAYEYLDSAAPQAGTVHYYLEDIDLDGKVTRHGPVTVELPGTGTRTRDSGRRALAR